MTPDERLCQSLDMIAPQTSRQDEMNISKKTKLLNRGLWIAAAIVAAAFSAPGPSQLAAKDRTLASVHSNVVKEFGSVRHMSAREFSALERSKFVIFDVREDDEYAVSHLSRAIRVDPDIAAGEFMRKYANQIAGKTVIVYCSVGVRSSALAERITPALKTSGKSNVYNLTGGIFQWHNEKRPLTRGTQSTRYVHPYNRSWGRLITDEALISYTPR